MLASSKLTRGLTSLPRTSRGVRHVSKWSKRHSVLCTAVSDEKAVMKFTVGLRDDCGLAETALDFGRRIDRPGTVGHPRAATCLGCTSDQLSASSMHIKKRRSTGGSEALSSGDRDISSSSFVLSQRHDSACRVVYCVDMCYFIDITGGMVVQCQHSGCSTAVFVVTQGVFHSVEAPERGSG